MRIFTHEKSWFRHLCFVVFNAGAVRKASALQLLSRKWCLGAVVWAISAGMLLFRLTTHVAWPEWFVVLLTLFSVFTGCCWVAFPFWVYLERRGEQLLAHQIMPGNLINTLAGVSLWHQAIQGKLPLQFLGALLLDFGFVWLLFPWQTMVTWQALFRLAFFLNTVFFVVFPFLLFLGYWTRRGMHKELRQRRHRTRLKQAKEEVSIACASEKTGWSLQVEGAPVMILEAQTDQM